MAAQLHGNVWDIAQARRISPAAGTHCAGHADISRRKSADLEVSAGAGAGSACCHFSQALMVAAEGPQGPS